MNNAVATGCNGYPSLMEERRDAPNATAASNADGDGGRADRVVVVLWWLWPVVAWMLPILTAVTIIGAELGLMQLAVMMALVPLFVVAMIVILLVFAGVMPRRSLRRAGWARVPDSVVPFLLLQWSFVIAGIVSYDSDPERGGRPSLLQQVTGIEFGPATAWWMFGAAFLSWVVLCLSISSASMRTGMRKGWIIASIVALLIAPASLAVAPAILSAQATAVIEADSLLVDADGRTPVEVREMSDDEQITLLESRYEVAQQNLSTVRAIIAEEGWVYRGTIDGGFAAAHAYQTFDESDESSCANAAFGCYELALSFRREGVLDAAQRVELVEQLRDDGWIEAPEEIQNIAWEYSATSPDGRQLTISESDGTIIVSMTTAAWWGDGEALLRSLMRTDPAPSGTDALWRADEWPAIDAE